MGGEARVGYLDIRQKYSRCMFSFLMELYLTSQKTIIYLVNTIINIVGRNDFLIFYLWLKLKIFMKLSKTLHSNLIVFLGTLCRASERPRLQWSPATIHYQRAQVYSWYLPAWPQQPLHPTQHTNNPWRCQLQG